MFIRAIDQPLIHFGEDHDHLILLQVGDRIVENEATIQLWTSGQYAGMILDESIQMGWGGSTIPD